MAFDRGFDHGDGERERHPSQSKADRTVQADAVFDQFVRLDKALTSTVDNVRARDRYLDRLHESLDEYVDENGPLEVEITARSFLLDGAAVCSGDGGEHITYRLYRYGLGEMGFYPGVEQEELRRFFALVEDMDRGREKDDLAARIWRLGFQGIAVQAREEPWRAPGETARSVLGQAHRPKDLEADLARAASVAPPPPAAEAAEETAEDEAEEAVSIPAPTIEIAQVEVDEDALAERLRFEDRYDPYVDFTRLLLDIMSQETLEAILQDVAEIIERLLDQLLDGWRHEDAVRVIKEARRYQREKELTEAQAEAFSNLLARLSSPEKIEKIVALMQRGDEEGVEALARFLRSLEAEAIPTILEGAGEKNLDTFADVVADIAGDRMELLLKHTSASRPLEVRCAVRALARKRHRPAIEEFRALRSHPDPDVRVEAFLGARAVMPDSDEDEAAFIQMVLEDGDPRFKVNALQEIPGDAFGAAEGLRRYITSKEFYPETFDVKREMLRAYCRVAPAVAPDVFEEQFFSGWTWLRRGQDRDDARRLAAFALGELGTDHAVEVLKGQLDSWNKTVSEACRIALAKKGES